MSASRETMQAIRRLHSQNDFGIFLEYLDSERETATNALKTAEENTILMCQGRCRALDGLAKCIETAKNLEP